MTENSEMRQELEALSTEELVSILRNRDEEEWRPEAFAVVAEILAARGVAPAEVEAMGPEGVEVAESQPLATVGRYFSPALAHAHRMALEARDIPAWVSDESGGTIYSIAIGARLQVRAQDEAAAREVLEREPPPELAVSPDDEAAAGDTPEDGPEDRAPRGRAPDDD